MFIEALKLIGLPVAAEDTLSKVGTVKEIAVEPANGRILGFLVSAGGFLAKAKALSIIDVKFWDQEAVVTDKVNNLVDPQEIVRIKNLQDKKFSLLGLPAKTEAGKSLGHVEDFLIDTQTESVAKYYLKDLLGQTRIMPADKVISIDKAIVFADDAGEVSSGVMETQIA